MLGDPAGYAVCEFGPYAQRYALAASDAQRFFCPDSELKYIAGPDSEPVPNAESSAKHVTLTDSLADVKLVVVSNWIS